MWVREDSCPFNSVSRHLNEPEWIRRATSFILQTRNYACSESLTALWLGEMVKLWMKPWNQPMYDSTLPAREDFYGAFHMVLSYIQAAISELTTDLGNRPLTECQVVCCHGTHNGCGLACLCDFTSQSSSAVTQCGWGWMGSAGWGNGAQCEGQWVGIGCFLFYSGSIILHVFSDLWKAFGRCGHYDSIQL